MCIYQMINGCVDLAYHHHRESDQNSRIRSYVTSRHACNANCHSHIMASI